MQSLPTPHALYSTHCREEIGSDDMDIRVKYAGMFHRKKATPGRFMMRLRLPNGIIRSSDMRYCARFLSLLLSSETVFQCHYMMWSPLHNIELDTVILSPTFVLSTDISPNAFAPTVQRSAL